MDAIIKFKEAAKELQNDERYLRLAAARKANDEDAALQTMLKDFGVARDELNEELGKEPRDDAKMAAMNEKVSELYNRIMQNPSMTAYNDAKDEIERFMAYVNDVLNAAINGEDPMLVEAPQEGCSDADCASCSGCH